ncbi:MAG: holo-[acyl-carrier-protein] synthase [Anaplasma sp.]
MIIGIGVDLVCVSRVQRVLERFGSRFTDRVFSEVEIRDSLEYKNPRSIAQHFAKRFAAKEAYVKAVGLGFGRGIQMRCISVHSNPLGRPCIVIEGTPGQYSTELSLSDDGEYAIAFVVLHSPQ